MSVNTPVAAETVLFVFLCLVLWLVAVNRARLPLPPSPGSVKFPSNEKNYVMYANWSKELGPLMTLPGPPLGYPVIVINTTTAANDLLEKRRSFACRPRFPLAELMGRQHNIAFTYYGDRLQKMRKALHTFLNAKAVQLHWGQLLDMQSLSLVQRLFEAPQTYYESIESNARELIIHLAYGFKPDTEYIRTAKEVTHETLEALKPRQWMVNDVPALKWVPSWMPGAVFKRKSIKARQLFMQVARKPFYEVKNRMARGRAEPSFVQMSLEELPPQHSTSDEEIIMYAAGSLFSAGTDTIASTILTFMLMMAGHEDVQQRAYEEIVNVVGTSRLPDLRDQLSLRFVDSIIQEVHRFQPAVPLASKSNYAEEEYHGWRIPKKSFIMANVWAMVHDEEIYASPDKFMPQRFMSDEGTPVPPDPRTWTYGFGRRRCPGLHLANATVYLNVARILALFTISPEIVDGKPAPPPLEFTTAFVPAPKTFKCRIQPRPNAADLLSHA